MIVIWKEGAMLGYLPGGFGVGMEMEGRGLGVELGNDDEYRIWRGGGLARVFLHNKTWLGVKLGTDDECAIKRID